MDQPGGPVFGRQQFDDIFQRDASVRGSGRLAANQQQPTQSVQPQARPSSPAYNSSEVELPSREARPAPVSSSTETVRNMQTRPGELAAPSDETSSVSRETRRIKAAQELDQLEREVRGQLGAGGVAEAEQLFKQEKARQAEIDRDGATFLEVQDRGPKTLGLPRDMDLLAEVRDDTVYAAITSLALKAAGRRQVYRVPDGFRGLLTKVDGSGGQLMISGEVAEGDFILHLFREETINAIHAMERLLSSDGFQTKVTAHFSVRIPRRRAEALRDFIETYVDGRSHLSLPLLKDRLNPLLRDVLGAQVKARPAGELNGTLPVDEAESELADRIRRSPLGHGLEFLGLNRIEAESPEFAQEQERKLREAREAEVRAVRDRERSEAERAEAARREEQALRAAEEQARKIEREGALRALAEKQAAGQELSREELGLLLDAARHKRRMHQMDLEREKLERERELDQLERLHRSEKLNAASALQRMGAEHEMEFDRQKLADYSGMVEEARVRLQEDRLEAYILTIKDEGEKVRLIEKMLDIKAARDLTDEQYSRLLASQQARSGSLRAVLPPELTTTRVNESSRRAAVPAISPQTVAQPAALSPSLSSDHTQRDDVWATPHPSMESQRQPQASARQREQLAPAEQFRSQQLPPVEASGVSRPMAQMAANAYSQHTAAVDLHAEHSRLANAIAMPHGGGEPELAWVLMAAGRRVYYSAYSTTGRLTPPGLLVDLSNESLGSLRSLQLIDLNGRRTLLAGARRGIYAIDAQSRKVDAYPLDAFNPDTGVNAVVAVQGKYYGTHSQYGLLRWSIPAPGTPATRFFPQFTEGARTVRSLFLDEGRWPTFACGRMLLAIEHGFTPAVAAKYDGAPSVIVCAISRKGEEPRHPGWFFAVCEDGTLVCWKKDEPRNCRMLSRIGEPVSDATPSTDGKSLVIATKSRHILLYDTERGVFARYDSPVEIRHAREYGSHLVGLTADRNTLLVWDSRGTGQPSAEITLPESAYDLMGV